MPGGNPIIAGESTIASSATVIESPSNVTLQVANYFPGGSALQGSSNAASGTGVHGLASGMPGEPPSSGMRGESTHGVGVLGTSVHGEGVVAETQDGYALRASGRIRIDNAAGVVEVAAHGQKVVTVRPDVLLTDRSIIFVEFQSEVVPPVLYVKANVAMQEFYVSLSGPIDQQTRLGWLVIN